MAERIMIGPKLRFEVFKRDNYTCQYCGKSGDGIKLHVDHIRPVASGGGNDRMNLITACAECNMGKGACELTEQQLLQLEKRIAQREGKMVADGVFVETKSKRVQLCVYPSVCKQIKEIASERGYSFNEFVNQILERFVGEWEKAHGRA